MTAQSTQIYQVSIKASPERVWAAITTPEETQAYFHGARITATKDWYISYGPEGDVWGDGPVMEYDPPRKLVHQWQSLYDPELSKEEPSRVTWLIEPREGGLCQVTVTHDQLENAPKTAESISGPGWTGVLGGLKNHLESAA